MHHNKDVGVADDCQELEIKILSNSDIKSIGFETKPNRHGLFSGMYFEQSCYDARNHQTLSDIRTQHDKLKSNKDLKSIFELETTTKWFGQIECSKPSYAKIYQHLQSQSFSMETPKSKDASTHPIWTLSYSTAKMVANWQAARSRNQNPDLMNDPAMLAFEEIKQWLTDELSISECNTETLTSIANRRHYLNEVFYLLNSFNNDKRQLLAVEDQLNLANNLIHQCIQNKRSPEILKELIINIDTVATTLANYLHFILIDENVTDNFSLNNAYSNENCISPLCKILNSNTRALDQRYLPSTFSQSHSSSDSIKQLKIDLSRLNQIQFASAVSQSDKAEYLKAATYLELMLELKQTFTKIKDLQLKIGSFNTVYYFKKPIELLTNNLITVLDACKSSMQKLFQSANKLKKMQLNTPQNSKNSHFTKNLATLETILAKGTTMEDKFNGIINEVINVSSHYQNELKKMLQNIENGSEQQAINKDVYEIIEQLNHFNHLIPAIIEKDEFSLEYRDTIFNFPDSLPETREKQETRICLPRELSYLETKFQWDKTAKIDPTSNIPIFTLRAYTNGSETGHIEFYAKPFLCFSADATRHNALNFTGIFEDYVTNVAAINYATCETLPASQWSALSEALIYASCYGAARGLSQSIAKKIEQQNYGHSTSIVLNQLFYITALFSINFTKNYEGTEIDQLMTSCIQASIDTGNMMLSSTVINSINLMLNAASQKLITHGHPYMGKTIKHISDISWYGIYAFNSFKDGFWHTSLKTSTGIASEQISNFLGNYFLGTT